MTDAVFRILLASRPSEREQWLGHWNSWKEREVQAHPSYVSLFADEGSAAMAAALHSESGSVLFPFILRLIPPICSDAGGNLTDIVSPYGYGGAYAWDVLDRHALAAEFWKAFTHWATNNQVVSEFLRLSLFDESLLPYPGQVAVKQDNVVVDLTLPPDDLWMSFDHKVRKNVNKARRSGVEIQVDTTDSRFDDFLQIYTATMDRRGAAESYYFQRDFFEAIHRELFGHFAYFYAIQNGKVVSTELALLSAQSAYSFLGGTIDEAFASRPNDLLKVEIMRWASENGRRWFVLGGGYGPGDGIFRYKRAFAPHGVRPFTVGTRIIDRKAYRRLTDARISSNDIQTDTGYFPAYRA